MKGCYYCDLFKPTWEQLKKKHNHSNIQFMDYERFSQPSMIQQYNIRSFPTLIKHPKNKDPIIYEGDRTIESLEQFLKLN